MIYQEDEVLKLLKKHSEKTDEWVKHAREESRTLKALVNGEDFHEELIERIEHLESQERAEVRRKYSKDIRDLFARVMKKRQNVFDANGGSESLEIESDAIREAFYNRISSFKANKSLYNYLAENYFQLADVDPNGIIFLEYKDLGQNNFKLYPVYKSIDYIRYYEDDGQLVDYLIFEPKVEEQTGAKIWRFVDDAKDYTVIEIQGNFVIDREKTFEHPFGQVPCLILSEKRKIGSKQRISPINDITELAKDYARDKSVLTIYKFQKGAPLHWRYGSTKCKTCNGLGKTGDAPCASCDGKGTPRKVDVSDVNLIPIPKDGQPFLADKIGGFISPDLDTWKQYKEDLRDAENLIEDTIWGTDRTHQSDYNNETATGRFIDIQPITNTLNSYSDVVQYIYNTLANWTLNFVDQTKDKTQQVYHRAFGRNYIIESPNTLLTKYGEAKKSGDNNTILDKLLDEIILSKYKSDPKMQAKMLKKARVEPYVHLSPKEVFDFFGAVEANKKVLFNTFWQDADKEKTADELRADFDVYFNANNRIGTQQPIEN